MSDLESSRQNERLEDATPTVLEGGEYLLPPPTIPNVPPTLRKREGLAKYFEPIMFSFGPSNRGKFPGGENMKLKLASHFLRENKIEKAKLWKDIVWNLDYLMINYYGQNKPLKEKKDLARVFFFDGCAVLHFIYCIAQNELQELDIQEDEVAFVQRDIFLLENQLPYYLLEVVINNIKEKKQNYRDAIAKFVEMNLMAIFKGREKAAKGTSSLGGKFVVDIEAEGSPDHLLDLLHRQFLVNMKGKKGVSSTLLARIGNKLPECMQKILEFYVEQKCEMESKLTESFSYGLLNRSVKELKASGIKLRPREELSLCHITFQGHFGLGTLKLPRVVVDDSTATKLFNLIAYEMCPNYSNEFVVISYARFLSSIIDKPKDVRELRKANILVNMLDSDQIIANLFNDISRNLAYYPDIHRDVKQQIEDHCNSTVTTWTSQLLQKYFDSPWAGLAFFGALLGLTLSLIQTYYTVRPEWW